MKVLVILAHPDGLESSFNHALFNTVVTSLTEAGNEVKTTDLYKLNLTGSPSASDFNVDPKAVPFAKAPRAGELIDEIKQEQDKVVWSTHIVVVAPIYWGTLPGSFHSYVERVFLAGKAYDMQHLYENGYWSGKKALIITTTGGPKGYYEEKSMSGSIDFRLYPITFGTFWFCGIKPIRSIPFFSAPFVPQEVRTEWLTKLSVVVKKLDQMELLPLNPTAAFFSGQPVEKMNWDMISEQGQQTIDELYEKLK